ncbi:MAG: hypothetical protein AB8B56_08630, partial [Crocinitomicaceae bacterium]
DITFIDGGALFRKIEISSKVENIEFTIENPNILEIFDQVKYFFYRVFNSRTISISGRAIYKFGKILRIENIRSREIESIDKNFINEIKYIQIAALPKLIRNDDSISDASVLLYLEDLNEVFKKEHEDSILLTDSPKEIIETLISQNPRNKNQKQLMYLSGKLHNQSDNIMYTLTPEFGFIFFIHGNGSYHYCWELLNSHATYIWSFNEKISRARRLEELELSVNIIFEKGRKYYKNALKQELFDFDCKFQLISHPAKKDDEFDRFKVWKTKLTEIVS